MVNKKTARRYQQGRRLMFTIKIKVESSTNLYKEINLTKIPVMLIFGLIPSGRFGGECRDPRPTFLHFQKAWHPKSYMLHRNLILSNSAWNFQTTQPHL